MDKYLISRYQSGKGKYILYFQERSLFSAALVSRPPPIDLSMMSPAADDWRAFNQPIDNGN
jgi:hypothetical protein